MSPKATLKAIAWVLPATLLALAGCQKAVTIPPNTPITPATHTFFPITAAPHAVDCGVCHNASTPFTQANCLSCHQTSELSHEQPVQDLLHASVIGYSYASQTNSAGRGCYDCHPTGQRILFDHCSNNSCSVKISSGCVQCHAAGNFFAALNADWTLNLSNIPPPPNPTYIHQILDGGVDCSGCHPSTATWATAGAPTGPVMDHKRDITVDAGIPTYAATSIQTISWQQELLNSPMMHSSSEVPPVGMAACTNCHQTAASGSYYPGNLHSSLDLLQQTQPTACVDCHTVTRPTGFVGPIPATWVRTPASGEMKHDAVVWSNGAPTATPIVTQDCAQCHVPPSAQGGLPALATWATSKTGTTPAQFHSSLTTQPSSCLDCHANSRSANGILNSTNSTLTGTLQFDHTTSAALGECNTCHSSFTAWSGGHFHLASSQTPSTCLPCHAGERPTSTATWASTTYKNSPFDYVTNANGILHGAGQDCVTCHTGPGTGAWGGTQNWIGGTVVHSTDPVAATTCIDCHMSNRPDLTTPTAATMLNFDHSTNGTGDCFGCHQATVTRGVYVSDPQPLTGMNSSDWQGGQSYPGSTLISSATQNIHVTEITLTRSGTYNLVSGMTFTPAVIKNQMLHTSTQIPGPWQPGLGPDESTCWHCHNNNVGAGCTPSPSVNCVTGFANGEFHPVLSDGGFSQPTSGCLDCHVNMRPPGIVQVDAGTREFVSMDHDAGFLAAVTIGGQTVTNVMQLDCHNCHKQAGVTWGDGVFHANIGTTAQPNDCTICHYPVMADTAHANLTGAAGTDPGTFNYAMVHPTPSNALFTFQNCSTCHTGALGSAATAPLASTSWLGGQLHASVSPQPSACVTCHAVTMPLANQPTTSTVAYTFNNGGSTGTNSAQWMNHGASFVASAGDCATCHAADAKTSGSAWSKSDAFHPKVALTSSSNCTSCHGLINAGGTGVDGTNNNLPSGLTFSSNTTDAGNDSATGIAPGTHDQIDHSDINVASQNCAFCHSQYGTSTVSGIQGSEWAQAKFHVNFTAGTALTMNLTTGRCSNCHMNVKPSSTTFQSNLQTTFNARASSVSGVNVDQELADLTVFQNMYAASAHVITAVDSMLTTLMQIQ